MSAKTGDRRQGGATTSERRGEASAKALSGLRAALSQGGLRGGEPVLEQEWASRLGISRTPIRAAVGTLAAEGLLVKRGRQVYVFQPSLSDLIDVYEIRKVLEGLAASLAAAAPSRESIAGVAEDLATMRAAEGTAQWFTAHELFHMGIFEGCGNGRLVDLIRSLRTQSEPYVRFAVHSDPQFRARAMHDHRQMVAALRGRESPKMAELVERHLNSTLSEVDRLLALTGNQSVLALASPVFRKEQS